ncbi:GIY-YIG nuclease family protein [Halorubrum sp. HHNYT27]|uniref:GIY-YIG nuclease family protein n=1 Tax=Halorubrum sp. HHNYT27 TaxID=3402275 RepID=UPI003EB8D2D1
MPYTDPHVAAPSLWAVRQEYGPEFQVSVVEPDDVDKRRRRLSIEEALIAVYRRESGENTTANFGRIIDGYKRSSMRSSGFTGGTLTDDETESNSAPGIGPLPWTDADEPTSRSWMGLDWTAPEPLANAYGLPTDPGVYRIWDQDEPEPLEYIGQSGNLKSRLYQHRRNRDAELVFSYAILREGDEKHKREQVETDLIGAHWLATKEAPREQF